MSYVILDAMNGENDISHALERVLRESGQETSAFKLRDMKILHCRSCGACAYKSPGKCVFDDDMHKVLKAAAGSSAIVMLTPIRFGGYSSELKKAVDKIALMALPGYFVKGGRLLHPTRYGNKTLIGIGVVEKEMKGQEESFIRLVEANALNLQYTPKTLVLRLGGGKVELEKDIQNLIKDISKICDINQSTKTSAATAGEVSR